LERAGLLDGDAAARDPKRIEELTALVQEGLKSLAEAPEALEFFFKAPPPAAAIELLQANKFAKKHRLAEIGRAFDDILPSLAALAADGWTTAGIEAVLNAELEKLGWKKGELLMAVRIAATGREATPSLFHTLESLRQPATLERLRAVRALLPAS